MKREEKSLADWMNQHILEQMNCEEKKEKAIGFQSTNKKSMVGQFSKCCCICFV